MSSQRWVLGLVSAVAALGLTACQGDEPKDAKATKDCEPGESAATFALVEDKAALPAGNWVPVVDTRGTFRSRLQVLDAASLGLSQEDLASIRDTAGEERRGALAAAVADVSRVGRRTPDPYVLAVPSGDAGDAIGSYYRAALARLGVRATVRTMEASRTVAAAKAGRVDAAVVDLATLGGVVDAVLPEGGDTSAQVQAVATAALDQQLALGATSAATSTPRVVVSQGLAEAHDLVTVSDLAEACPEASLAAQSGAREGAETIAEAYGLDLVDAPAGQGDELFGEAGVLAVVLSTSE